jgi:purine-cytosine permease-like protein
MTGFKVLFLLFIIIYIISWITVLIVGYLFKDYFIKDTEKDDRPHSEKGYPF